jgi:hypothetical protein
MSVCIVHASALGDAPPGRRGRLGARSPIASRTSYARRSTSPFAWSTIANIFAAGDSYSTFFDAGHTLNFTALAQTPTNLVGRLRIRGHC